MTRLNSSFVNSLKNELSDTRFSAKDFIFEDSTSGKTLINIKFKYNDSFSFEITEETEIEVVTEKGPFSTIISGTTERKNKSVVNYVLYSPGKYKKHDKIDIYNIGDASEYLSKWCDYIFDEVSHMKEDDSPYDHLRDEIENILKNDVENENESFNDEELNSINNKFDELLNKFEILQEENKITKAELDKVKNDFNDFKNAAKTMPKGLWARVTNNKLVDIVVAFGKSKEGREFIIGGIKKLMLPN